MTLSILIHSPKKVGTLGLTDAIQVFQTAPFKDIINIFSLKNYYSLSSHDFFCFNSEYPSQTACKIRKQARKLKASFPAHCVTQPRPPLTRQAALPARFSPVPEVKGTALPGSLPRPGVAFPGAASRPQPRPPRLVGQERGMGRPGNPTPPFPWLHQQRRDADAPWSLSEGRADREGKTRHPPPQRGVDAEGSRKPPA